MYKELICLNSLIHSRLFTRKALRSLKSHYKSWSNITKYIEGYILSSLFIKQEKLKEILRYIRNTNPEEIYEKYKKLNISVISQSDVKFPSLLKEIDDSPLLIYIRGNVDESKKKIAIVGSRSSTLYGKQVTEKFSTELSMKNVCIVSGLALGIDAISHEFSYANPGKTIAVLGHGLDNIYPRQNYKLAMKILENGGGLVSEYPLGSHPEIYHFPERNRIISGLSNGVLIVEAGKKSGSLITATTALDQNRDVFAIPGSVFNDMSIGTNHLIASGAVLTTSTNDIFEQMNWNNKETQLQMCLDTSSLSELEISIYKKTSFEPIRIDRYIEIFENINSQKITTTLSQLELKGFIKNIGGGSYIRG